MLQGEFATNQGKDKAEAVCAHMDNIHHFTAFLS